MNETVTIVGNVGSTPEQRHLSAGGHVTGFKLVSTERRRDRDSGAWVDGHSNWYDVSVFRTLGENAFESLRKGQRVIVIGRLRLKSWETDSSRGVSAQIEADSVGHDLLWGTSEFRKRDAAARTPGQATDAAAPVDPASTEPAPAEPATAQQAPAEQAPDPLAGWGASALAPQELAETPF